MTIHDFDMVRFLAGCNATEVYVEAAVLVDPAIGEPEGCRYGSHHTEDGKWCDRSDRQL